MAVGAVVMSRAQLVVGAPVALVVGRWRFSRLRRAGARPYALAGTRPGILWQDGWSGGSLTDVVLAYGYPHAVSRPFTEVETCFAGSSSAAPSLEVAIARAEHRDEFFARWEWVGAGALLMTRRPQLSRRVGTVVTSAWSVWTVWSGQWRWSLVVTMRRCGSVRARLLSRRWPGSDFLASWPSP